MTRSRAEILAALKVVGNRARTYARFSPCRCTSRIAATAYPIPYPDGQRAPGAVPGVRRLVADLAGRPSRSDLCLSEGRTRCSRPGVNEAMRVCGISDRPESAASEAMPAAPPAGSSLTRVREGFSRDLLRARAGRDCLHSAGTLTSGNRSRRVGFAGGGEPGFAVTTPCPDDTQAIADPNRTAPAAAKEELSGPGSTTL